MQTQKKKANRLKIKPRKQKSNENIIYITKNTEQNTRKDSTGKNEINNRVQNVGEIVEDKTPVEMRNIQTKAKQ